MTPLAPVLAMLYGMRLHPGDPEDPLVFRSENLAYGMTNRVVFPPGSGNGWSAGQVFMDLFSLRKRSEARNGRPWVTGLAMAGSRRPCRHCRNTPA